MRLISEHGVDARQSMKCLVRALFFPRPPASDISIDQTLCFVIDSGFDADHLSEIHLSTAD